MENYDLAIIGSGPGGYVAAIRAAQLNINVVVIEKADLGGVCLNWGCIPTKSLLRTTEIYDFIKDSSKFGIESKSVKISIDKVVKRSRDIAKKLSEGIHYLFKKNNIKLIKANAFLENKNTIKLTSSSGEINTIFAKNIIIATGAGPKNLELLNNNKNFTWNYLNAMVPDNIPDKLGIIGSGAIGIEFACFYNSIGSKVVVFEAKSRILPNEDKEVSSALETLLKAKGIKFQKNAKIKNSEKDGKDIKIFDENTNEGFAFSKILVAVGIKANIEGIGINNTKVNITNGHIDTNFYGQTNVDNIFAIGDVTGGPWLAHKASHEGIRCVEFIAGIKNIEKSREIKENIPSCIYSSPQVASIGITEEQAIKEGKSIKVGKFPLAANGKALTLSESDGFVKTIFDKNTGEILGAHLIGAEVTELINSFAVAMKLEATEEEFFETVFPHPTLSESILESSLDAFKRAIHI